MGGSGTTSRPMPPSIISADLHVIGDMRSQGEVQVDGVLEGDIETRALLIGETARIKGQITAEVVRVHGSVEGQIKARSVTLAKKAHVIGDILHEDLSIETGAFLEGHCKRVDFPREEPENDPKTLSLPDLNKGGDKAKDADTSVSPKKTAAAPA